MSSAAVNIACISWWVGEPKYFEPHVLRRLMIDDLLSGFGAVANTEDVDLQDRLEQSKTLGRNDGERTRMLAEMAVPNIQKFGQIVDVGQVALRLDRVRQGTAAGFKRGLEP